MDNKTTEQSLWGLLEGITDNLKYKRLADVFRFVSFQPFETFGPHQHLRIEINYVKKGNCILHLENESISFNENEMMIICSNVEHTFEAGSEGTTLMQLEFLPEIRNTQWEGKLSSLNQCEIMGRGGMIILLEK